MTVEGQPEIPLTASHTDRHHRAPTAESAIGKIKLGLHHTVFTINSVI